MTRFIYFCKDNNEFIKFLENLDTINKKKDFFYSNEENTFVIDYSKDSKFTKESLIKKFEIISNSFPNIKNDIVYISIHPGGTSNEEIKEILENLNKSIEDKVCITYHGSQNPFVKEILDKDSFNFDKLNKGTERYFNEYINRKFYTFLKNDLEEFLLVEEKFAEQLTTENHSDNLFNKYKKITSELIDKRLKILKKLDEFMSKNH